MCSICIYPTYACDCRYDHDFHDITFLCTYDFSPIKNVFGFYIIGIPILVMLIYSFILTLMKKIAYNKLSSMECLEEYKNLTKFISEKKYHSEDDYDYYYDERNITYDFFEKSVTYNNAQFILILLTIILLILYPLLIICLYRPRPKKISKSNGKSTELYSKPLNDKKSTPS